MGGNTAKQGEIEDEMRNSGVFRMRNKKSEKGGHFARKIGGFEIKKMRKKTSNFRLHFAIAKSEIPNPE